MCRCAKRARLLLVLVPALLVCPLVAAQPSMPGGAEDALERYLRDLDHPPLLASHLRHRLANAPEAERPALAERLARVYVRLLEETTSADQRRTIERSSRELIVSVPEADSYELRITLGKARYLVAEEIAEQHRLLLAEPEEIREAIETLRELGRSFQEIGSRVHKRVEAYERLEDKTRDAEEDVKLELAESRRLRSLAMYYAGWSRYYLSFLTGSDRQAAEAMQDFGWLLNSAGGRVASVDRVPTRLLQYEHVARAAVGSALCESIRGNDIRALKWIEHLESSGDLHDAVRSDLARHRMVIYAAARRWTDLAWLIDHRFEGGLSVRDARLLAVVTLEGSGSADSWSGRTQLTAPLAQAALSQLIAQGQVEQVLDLVERFGADLIGRGFIVDFVRALQAQRELEEQHLPATQSAVLDGEAAARHEHVALLFEGAMGASDADQYPQQRARCGLLAARARAAAGQHVRAAEGYERVHAVAQDATLREQGLWHAVLALDAAIEGGVADQAPRRDRLATVYLAEFPHTERSARLLIRRAEDGLLADADAAEILLDIERSSPLYEAARRYASRLLYRAYRTSRGDRRAFLARRFADVAQEVIRFDLTLVDDPDPERADRARVNFIVRSRQVLDALLAVPSPDPQRAADALALLRTQSEMLGLDLSTHEDELVYRQLQIALASGDETRASALLGELDSSTSLYARSAQREFYNRALRQWKASPEDASSASMVVHAGRRVLRQFEEQEKGGMDPAAAGLRDAIAQAAEVNWEATGDASMRELALSMDRELIEASMAPARVLRRHAKMSEAAGNVGDAIDAWRRLMASVEPGTAAWYEPRCASIRLLATTDPSRANEALRQARVLYGEPPAPWDTEFDRLEALIGEAPALPGGGNAP